jgi:predicted TIM-barrel fold metal-dependent hydrolase
MDKQGLEATLLFPTLAVSVEQLVADDVDMTYANLHAFNQWLDDDWGFSYEQRIYGVPLLSLLDPFLAVDELEFVISRGARVVHLRSGPVAGRSPSDPFYDRFWRTVVDADLAVAFHACDDPYRHEMAKVWGWGNVNIPARYIPPLQRIIAGLGRPIHDMISSLIYGKLFERFPMLRVATVELGCDWVPGLFQNFERAGQGDLEEHPMDVFKKHVWVTPFEDEDIAGLAAMIGVERVLFGSDYPHTDGLAQPASIVDTLKGFSSDDLRKILYENPRQLVGAR